MKNIVLLISLFFNAYFIFSSFNGQESKTMAHVKTDKVKMKLSSIQKQEEIKPLKKLIDSKETKKENKKEQNQITEIPDDKPLQAEEKELIAQEEFDGLQRDFHKKFEKFTYEDLRLSESQILFYNDLKNERQKEIQDYLEPKWEEMRKNGKSTEYYAYTSEDLVFVGKLNEKYLSDLKREWGSDAFTRYQKFLNDYNNAQITSGSNIKFMIDF